MTIVSDAPLKPLRHVTPPLRTYYGPDSLQQISAELARAKAGRAVILCGASLARMPDALGRIKGAIGDRCAGVFAEVKGHSPLPSVLAARDALHDFKADAVIAVGGGSAVVTARAASILLAEKRDIHELCTQFPPGKLPVSPKLDAPKLPQFVIPTTPTTAYAKAGAAVVDPALGQRLALFDPKARALAIFIDPDLALTAPPALVLDAALHAFASAVQGIEARIRDPQADALLLHAIRLFRDHLPRLAANPDDASLRAQLMFGALLSGQGTDFTGAGVTAVVGHCVGARFHLENGATNAILLPHAIRFNAQATGARMAELAELFGANVTSPNDAPAIAADAVARFLAQFGVAAQLRDAGVSREALPQIAEDSMKDWFLQQNPRKVEDPATLMQLLDAAF